MPPDPLAAHAFGARNMLRLVLKSGYGPGTHKHKSKRKTMNRNVTLNKDVLLLNSRKYPKPGSTRKIMKHMIGRSRDGITWFYQLS